MVPAPGSPRPGPASAAGGLARLGLYWAPVWVPLLLLWQVSVRGLRPALEERARLAREQVAVVARYRDARERFERMDAEVRAWADPIYRERLRRARR